MDGLKAVVSNALKIAQHREACNMQYDNAAICYMSQSGRVVIMGSFSSLDKSLPDGCQAVMKAGCACAEGVDLQRVRSST